MDFNLSPEDIEKLVRDSIMKAGFGAAVVKGVTAALGGYNNPVDAEVKKYVGEVAASLIREKFAETIKAAVAAAIEARVTQETIDATVSAAVAKMQRAAEESRY